MTVAFFVPGEPVAKGRARAFVRHGHVAHYTPEFRLERISQLARMVLVSRTEQSAFRLERISQLARIDQDLSKLAGKFRLERISQLARMQLW